MIHHELAEEAEEDVFLDRDPPGRAPEGVRILLCEPQQLGQGRHRVDRGARAPVDGGSVHLLLDHASLFRGPVIGEGDQRRERIPLRIEPDQAVHRDAEGNARDLRASFLRGPHHAREGVEYRLEDPIRVLLCPAGERRTERVLPRLVGQEATVPGVRDRLGARRAYVDSYDRGRFSHADPPTPDRRYRNTRVRRSSSTATICTGSRTVLSPKRPILTLM
jgi:hypothetical protein